MNAQRVLDFGCGCARILRWLVERFPNGEFHGADVDRESVAWCARNLTGAQFIQAQSEPPLPYPSGYFDFAYCFSVFTHLNEAMQDRWLEELRRILKPAGVLLITVHGLRTAKASLDGSEFGELERKGILHKTTRKLKGIMPSWYNTTWHSQEYIVSRLEQLFDHVRYHPITDGMQDFVFARAARHV